VFARAQNLLAELTRGRYQLSFDAAVPAFSARDTVEDAVRDLDQLSSGTRLQLLLAVRLAFIEDREDGPRPPLIFDETLANSDHRRTAAMIEAAAQICRTGRQVFYLTARRSEVDAWRAAGQDGLLNVDLVDLEQTTREAETAGGLPVPAEPWRPPLPTPEQAADYTEYGRSIDAPPLDPARPAAQAHLWHLLETPETLHKVLSIGVERLGALEQMARSGGLRAWPEMEPEFQRALARGRMLKALFHDWRIGRGRPVDRRALLEGGVSDVFIDRVDALSRRLGGDPRRLLNALERGEIKRFQSSVRERLEQYLEEQGHLDPRRRLSHQQLVHNALAAAADDIREGAVTERDAAVLAARLPDLPAAG
jgi:hypothetical protein